MTKRPMETRVRSKLCKAAEKQGFWASNVNDQFMSAKPDMRIARDDVGQMDIELKILGVSEKTLRDHRVVNSGITPLQAIELREMNNHGAPAIGVILLPELDKFVFCNFVNFAPGLALDTRFVPYLGGEKQVDFLSLMLSAWEYLKEHYPYDRYPIHP